MLEDTLVIWGGEFGRTPTVELPKPGSNAGKINGRDHNHHGFSMWLAGGGVRGGYVHGATDEFGFAAVENKVHVHDLHATILQLLGFDHEKLTFRLLRPRFPPHRCLWPRRAGVDRVNARAGEPWHRWAVRIRHLWPCALPGGCATARRPPTIPRAWSFSKARFAPFWWTIAIRATASKAPRVKGGLLLDTREGVLKGGDTGPAIKPGDVEQSLLIKAVRYDGEKLRMPPKGKKLAAEKIAYLGSSG